MLLISFDIISSYKKLFSFESTRISGYFPDVRDFFDFRDLFLTFRDTLGKNVNNNFLLFLCKDTLGKTIFRISWCFLDCLAFPGFSGLFRAFLDFKGTFCKNWYIKHSIMTLLSIHCGYGCGYGSFNSCSCGYGYYCLCSISHFTPGLKETSVSSCLIPTCFVNVQCNVSVFKYVLTFLVRCNSPISLWTSAFGRPGGASTAVVMEFISQSGRLKFINSRHSSSRA